MSDIDKGALEKAVEAWKDDWINGPPEQDERSAMAAAIHAYLAAAPSQEPDGMPGVEAVAAFLKLRDEEVPDADDRTDDERAESAEMIAALFSEAFAAKEREIERLRAVNRAFEGGLKDCPPVATRSP